MTTLPTDWTFIGISFLIGCGIVGLIWWLRHNPGKVATAQAVAASAEAKAATATSDLASVAHRLTDAFHALTQTHAEAVAKIPTPTMPPLPPEPVTPSPNTEALPIAGRQGQAGMFVLPPVPVTGDTVPDLATIQAWVNAQYFKQG